MKKWQSQWTNVAACEGMDSLVLIRMVTLRRQMLLHAYIYYVLNDNILSDHEWDRRAQELYSLQKEHGWNIGFYDEIFKHWKGQSGYWLPTNKGVDENVDRVARRILDYELTLRRQPDAIKTGTGTISAVILEQTKEASKKVLDKI